MNRLTNPRYKFFKEIFTHKSTTKEFLHADQPEDYIANLSEKI